ncbi:MAG: hypothetical protein DRQ51_05305 [Gammaproteobacteria bacterium]|nr:MAG: hypothetical protein DRQ51_05305 [Gammaproteobacteria bacterium]
MKDKIINNIIKLFIVIFLPTLLFACGGGGGGGSSSSNTPTPTENRPILSDTTSFFTTWNINDITDDNQITIKTSARLYLRL